MTEKKAGSGLSVWGTSAGNTPKDPLAIRHTIDDISYARDFVVCACAWKGTVDEFTAHRREIEKLRRPNR
jgi:hypothetical protein